MPPAGVGVAFMAGRSSGGLFAVVFSIIARSAGPTCMPPAGVGLGFGGGGGGAADGVTGMEACAVSSERSSGNSIPARNCWPSSEAWAFSVS